MEARHIKTQTDRQTLEQQRPLVNSHQRHINRYRSLIMATTVKNPCALCKTPSSHLCNGCKDARYCSSTCQEADWRSHKLVCSAYGAFDKSSRPDNEHILAVFFPEDSKKPKLIWLHMNIFGENTPLIPGLKPFLGDVRPDSNTTSMNPLTPGEKLSKTIHIASRADMMYDGSKPSKSIANIGPKNGLYLEWRGPSVVRCEAQREGEQKAEPKDLDTKDFRHLLDVIVWHRRGRMSEEMLKGGRWETEEDMRKRIAAKGGIVIDMG